ncbi:MAG: dihydrolipoyl dehydrogenase [Clostridiaceae bacterium]|nr:dihydrolipoyl dehydrogenase [Clostridiaceae bacterium]
MDTLFDVVVIGGGIGGYTCAAKLASLGKKTALVERDQLGGTCLNRGCIPTKTLLHAASLLSDIERAAFFGLTPTTSSVDFPALKARKDEVVLTLRQGVERMLKSAKVNVIEGDAFVPAPGIVDVNLQDGESVRLTAQDLVVAVGSSPGKPPIPGLDLPGVWTSDDILEQVPSLDSLIIIGGGVIGMEFASFYASIGTNVTVLEALPSILPNMDRELGRSLTALMKKRGVVVNVSALVKEIVTSDDGLTVAYEVKGKMEEAKGEAVLISTGRHVHLEDVFAPSVLPQLDKGRAVTDRTMRTDIPHIYVIGDAAAGSPQLAHTASSQGLVAAAAIAGVPSDIDISLVPSCVYTDPEIACVGLTEAEAKDTGIRVVTGKCLTSASGKSLISGQERGFVKLVADENGVLLGGQLMCARATDMIGEIVAAISAGMTVKELASFVRPHPTFEESIGEAASITAEKVAQLQGQ